MTAPANEITPAAAPTRDDWAATLIEIKDDQRRLAVITDPNDLAREVSQTVLSYIGDLASRLVELRNYAHARMEELDGNVTALAELIDDDDSRLTEEDAQDFGRYVRGMQLLAQQFLERATGLNEEGRRSIQDMIELGKKLEQRIGEITMPAELPEGEEEEDEAGEDGATS